MNLQFLSKVLNQGSAASGIQATSSLLPICLIVVVVVVCVGLVLAKIFYFNKLRELRGFFKITYKTYMKFKFWCPENFIGT